VHIGQTRTQRAKQENPIRSQTSDLVHYVAKIFLRRDILRERLLPTPDGQKPPETYRPPEPVDPRKRPKGRLGACPVAHLQHGVAFFFQRQFSLIVMPASC
jgi:hypothetical protein